MNKLKKKNSSIGLTNNFFFSISDTVIDTITSFVYLKNGWDCGYGVAISSIVIEKSLNIYNRFKDPLFEYECTPRPNNSIELTFCLQDYFLSLKVGEEDIVATIEKGIGSVFNTLLDEKVISIDDIGNLLRYIKQLCFLLEPSTSQNINLKGKDLKNVLTSSEMAFPYFNLSAQKKSPSQFVYTYVNITPAP